jgi:hypothetical protein
MYTTQIGQERASGKMTRKDGGKKDELIRLCPLTHIK